MCPVLFFVGPIPVATYGLVLLLAAAVCFLYVLPRLARIEGLDPKESAWRGFLGLFIALVSAKLTALVLGLPSFLADPRTFANLLFSGGVLYGGIVGALLYGVWMAVVWKIDLLKFLDIAGPTTTVGVAIGRWGCFLSGCCFGRPTDLLWGVHFGNRMAHLLHPDLPDRTPEGAPIYLHPTQIYDSLNMAIITAILLLFYRRKRVDGEVACLSLILYGIGRSIVETFRGDAVRGTVMGGLLTTSQFLGLSLALVAAVGWFLLRRRAARAGAPAPVPASTAASPAPRMRGKGRKRA